MLRKQVSRSDEEFDPEKYMIFVHKCREESARLRRKLESQTLSLLVEWDQV